MHGFRKAIDLAKLLTSAAVPVVSEFFADERGMWGLPAQFGLDTASSGSGGPPSVIKSIQQVSITLGSGVTSNTATISSVTTGNCALFFQGSTTTQTLASNNNSVWCDIALTNSTTVTATRHASNTDSCVVKGVVVEFTSAAVASATQTGTITLASVASNTATITAVGANAFVLYLGATSTDTGHDYSNASCSVVLTNSTTVTAYNGPANTTTVVRYMVVDLSSAVVKSVQAGSGLLPNGTNTGVFAINTVNSGNSIYIHNGSTDTNSTDNATFVNHYIKPGPSSTDTIQIQDNITNSFHATTYYTLLEFQPAVLNGSVQRGLIAINGATSKTATITSVTTTKSFVNLAGISSGSSTTPNTEFADMVLTNATTVTMAVNSTATINGQYEVVQFA